MVTVVVVEFGVMRCQPLRRALCSFWGNKKPAFSAGFRICFIEPL
ncbi:acetyltransferase [Vibrio cholerae]|nr:acetyltransferase [Vibrio cholerae]EGR0597740.1 acetyltransferase [Vibrio cholerae]EGR1049534.1 acetyltransferase [Vibrio cholerae]EGR4348335.1 acetyltransferase [Vibrio cholerae]EJP6369672.1 acetyltransferase [Vibrio cholerae]